VNIGLCVCVRVCVYHEEAVGVLYEALELVLLLLCTEGQGSSYTRPIQASFAGKCGLHNYMHAKYQNRSRNLNTHSRQSSIKSSR
jgi:hypothetical protein